MRRCLLSTLALLLSTTLVVAQDNSKGDDEPKDKLFNHYLGVQVNTLLKQLFSLSNTTEVFVNPYYLNYQFNSNRTGWGMNFGIGYTIEQSETGDALTRVSTNSDQLDARMGPEWKKNLGRKWLVSAGLDLIYGKGKETTSSTSSGFFVQTLSQRQTLGAGPRGTVHFKLGKYVMIGTEASLYFSYTELKEMTSQGNAPFPSITENKPSVRNLIFLGPRYISFTLVF